MKQTNTKLIAVKKEEKVGGGGDRCGQIISKQELITEKISSETTYRLFPYRDLPTKIGDNHPPPFFEHSRSNGNSILCSFLLFCPICFCFWAYIVCSLVPSNPLQ